MRQAGILLDSMREYEDDELASDSDDDRKMKRAEASALRKKKAKLRKVLWEYIFDQMYCFNFDDYFEYEQGLMLGANFRNWYA